MEEPVAGVAPAPHTAPDKLSPLKVRDLHHLAQFTVPVGGAVYPPARPPADWEELVQATAAECAEMKGRGGHYHKLDKATVAEAVATSEQPPAEEATDYAANGVHVYPKAQLVLLACDCKIFLMSLVPAGEQQGVVVVFVSPRLDRKRGRNRVMWFII